MTAPAEHTPILVHREDGVLTLTLNRPGSLNAVTLTMLRQLAQLIRDPEPGTRVIVLAGAGRAFCSGADLSRRGAAPAPSEPRAAQAAAPPTPVDTIDAANALIDAITESPLPVIARVQGPCAGLGVSIAVAADIVVASTEAFFQLAFTRVGLMPDGGATALLPAAIGRARAARMALLAERITAAEALDSGLIAETVEPDALDSRVAELAVRFANGPAQAYALSKQALNAAALGALQQAFARERDGQARLLDAADSHEGARAFVEKRPPLFTDPPLG